MTNMMPTAEQVVEYLKNVQDIFGDMTVSSFIEHLEERLQDAD